MPADNYRHKILLNKNCACPPSGRQVRHPIDSIGIKNTKIQRDETDDYRYKWFW